MPASVLVPHRVEDEQQSRGYYIEQGSRAEHF